MAQDNESSDRDMSGAARAVAHRERARWIAAQVLPHEAELRRALARRAPAGFEVDDIVQEIYARLAGMASVEHIENPRSYVFRMASGVMVDFMRRQKVVPIQSVEDIAGAAGVSEDPSPEAVVVDRDQLRRLMRMLSELPPRISDVFRLRRVEGLSQREVSRRLGVPESTVEKRMARGVFLLARSFESGGEPEAESTKLKPSELSRDRGPRDR
ncbi:MAG: RNA polymerase sigma factor [Caulobacter sp.]